LWKSKAPQLKEQLVNMLKKKKKKRLGCVYEAASYIHQTNATITAVPFHLSCTEKTRTTWALDADKEDRQRSHHDSWGVGVGVGGSLMSCFNPAAKETLKRL
jgi:hypothetical protein